MAEYVHIETGDAAGVATIRLDRPKVNAINAQVTAELGAAVAEIARSTDLGAVVIWGGPRVFAAGADIGEFTGLDAASGRDLSARINTVLLAIEQLRQITISAVNGYALGGGMELAMSSDFRLAADNATFGQPEILLGLIPGGGGTQRLPRLVGVTKAKEIIYSGRQVRATEAAEIGLVSALYPADGLYDAALEAAAGYAAGPAALRMAKQAVMDSLALPLAEGVARESRHFGACFNTSDAHTGIASFLGHGPGKARFQQR